MLAHPIRDALADTPVVCVLGPRQCGKTTLVQQLDRDRAYLSLDDENYYRTATADPMGFVASLPEQATVDEVQRVPALLTSIKQAVDQNRQPGRFLLTGSANLLLLPQVAESLAGRMETVHLQPLTESEKARRPGRFLADMLGGGLSSPDSSRRTNVAQTGPPLAERLVAGGFPEPLGRPADRARQWHRQYLRNLIEHDLKDVADIRDGDEMHRLVELLALRNAQLFNASNLAADIGLHRETIERYTSALERLFIVRRLPAWHRRPAQRLVKTPKIYIVDSGIAATAAGLKSVDWLERRDRMGHLLESFAVQQLAAQAAWTDPDLRLWHYRDKDGKEVDVVVTLGQRTWGIEVKASATLGADDGRGLTRLADRCGSDFQQGIVLYDGHATLPLADKRLLAVPFTEVWSR